MMSRAARDRIPVPGKAAHKRLSPKVRRELWRTAKRFRLHLNACPWFDLWHTHVDWESEGMRSSHVHRDYLKALAIMYRQARKQLLASGRIAQIFMAIYPDDTGSDAIYVHTQNPQSAFPYEPSGMIELDVVPWRLRAVARLDQHRIMRCKFDGSNYFMVFPR